MNYNRLDSRLGNQTIHVHILMIFYCLFHRFETQIEQIQLHRVLIGRSLLFEVQMICKNLLLLYCLYLHRE
jgi:hypothetical protein